MNKEQRFLIELIKAQVEGGFSLCATGVNFNDVYELSKKQVLTPFFYYSILENNIDIDSEILKKAECLTKVLKTKDRLINSTAEEIIMQFEKNCICYLPLKGYVLKKLYKKSELRTYQDFDILVKSEDIEKAKKIMFELGYENANVADNHHIVFYDKSTLTCVEIHKELFEFEKFNKLNLSIETAVKDENNNFGYHFSLIDYYTHMLCHSAIHFATGGGIGLRSVIDIFVYLKQYKNEIDFNILNDKLKKVGLVNFRLEMEKLTNALFLNGAEDSITKKLEEIVFSSSTLNNKKYEGAVRVVRNGNKIKAFFNLLFPPYRYMTKSYKWLKKCPILLPFAYLIRLFNALFFKHKNIKSFNQTMLSNNNNIKEISKILKSLNLDDLGKY